MFDKVGARQVAGGKGAGGMAQRPDDVQCLEHLYGPPLAAVEVFFDRARLLYVTMFTTSRAADTAHHLRQVAQLNRTTALATRRYVEALGHECGSNERQRTVDACHDGRGARLAEHRCTGAAGGHADLVAWDIVEWMHEHAAAVG